MGIIFYDKKVIKLDHLKLSMKKLTKEDLESMFQTKKLDSRVSWFYIQFKNKFQEEYVIDGINLQQFIGNLIKFLKNREIGEIVFFPEPKYPEDIPGAIVQRDELEKFLGENVNTSTNTHIASKNLDWIITITHEDDFFISGDKNFVMDFIKFFKDAHCTPYKEIEAKWKNK